MHRKYMSFPVFPWVCNSHLARVYYLTGPFIRFGIVGGGGGRWPITISSVVVVEFSQAFSRVPREVMAKVAALSHCTAAFVSSSFKRVVGIGTSTTDRQSRDWPQNGQTGHTHTHTPDPVSVCLFHWSSHPFYSFETRIQTVHSANKDEREHDSAKMQFRRSANFVHIVRCRLLLANRSIMQQCTNRATHDFSIDSYNLNYYMLHAQNEQFLPFRFKIL